MGFSLWQKHNVEEPQGVSSPRNCLEDSGTVSGHFYYHEAICGAPWRKEKSGWQIRFSDISKFGEKISRNQGPEALKSKLTDGRW